MKHNLVSKGEQRREWGRERWVPCSPKEAVSISHLYHVPTSAIPIPVRHGHLLWNSLQSCLPFVSGHHHPFALTACRLPNDYLMHSISCRPTAAATPETTAAAAAAAAVGIIHLTHLHGGGKTMMGSLVTPFCSCPSSSALRRVASATSDWPMP